jgi:WD40 repeat protein
VPSGKKVEEFKIGGMVETVGISSRSMFGLASTGKELHLLHLPPEKVPYRRMQRPLAGRVKGLALSPEGFDVLGVGTQISERYPLSETYGTTEIQGAGPSSSVAFSPDGARFLLARSQPDRLGFGSITLRDTPKTAITGDTTVRRYQGHRGGTTAAVFTRNANRIISGGLDNYVRVWETSTEQELSAIDVGGPVAALAISSDARQVAIATDAAHCEIWNLETKTRLGALNGHALAPRAVAWAKKASRVATGSGDKSARVWDPQTYAAVATFEHPTAVTCVEITPDGKWLVSGGEDGYLRVWDIEKQQAGPAWWAHEGAVTATTLGHDGKTLVSAGADLTLSWWDIPKD